MLGLVKMGLKVLFKWNCRQKDKSLIYWAHPSNKCCSGFLKIEFWCEKYYSLKNSNNNIILLLYRYIHSPNEGNVLFSACLDSKE